MIYKEWILCFTSLSTNIKMLIEHSSTIKLSHFAGQNGGKLKKLKRLIFSVICLLICKSDMRIVASTASMLEEPYLKIEEPNPLMAEQSEARKHQKGTSMMLHH